MLTDVLCVAAGGAAGAAGRYGISRLLHETASGFPLPTFLINLLACFLLGFFGTVMEQGGNRRYALFLTTGFCGGFSTFSTFALEGIGLLSAGKFWLSVLYICGSVFCGLLGYVLGRYCGLKLVR